jgi:hypothetical protein
MIDLCKEEGQIDRGVFQSILQAKRVEDQTTVRIVKVTAGSVDLLELLRVRLIAVNGPKIQRKEPSMAFAGSPT